MTQQEKTTRIRRPVGLLIGLLCIIAAIVIAFAVNPGMFHRMALEIKPYFGFPPIEEELEDALRSIVTDSIWENADRDERAAFLQVVSDAEAKCWGTPAPYIKTADLGWFGPDGSYYPESNEIVFNMGYIETMSGPEALFVCLHEGYHGYQRWVVEGLVPEPEPDKRELWKSEFDYPMDAVMEDLEKDETLSDEEKMARYYEIYTTRDTERTAYRYASEREAYFMKMLGLSDLPKQ